MQCAEDCTFAHLRLLRQRNIVQPSYECEHSTRLCQYFMALNSDQKCPLCDTPVYNPKAPEPEKQPSPFPKEKGQVEVVKRKDLGVLLTVIVLATAVTCGLLNAFVFRSSLWSLAVIGVVLVLWVIMIPVVIYTRQPIYLSILLDGVAVIGVTYKEDKATVVAAIAALKQRGIYQM